MLPIALYPSASSSEKNGPMRKCSGNATSVFDRRFGAHAARCCILHRCKTPRPLAVNPEHLLSAISTQWDAEIVPQLTEYIRIPAKSPHFDPQWEINGHIERAIRLAEAWVGKQPVRGLTFEIVRLPGRTPLLYFDVAGTGDRGVLLYGHLDKQPEMVGWREGFGPWDPLFENGKLYGRGSADDGYGVSPALASIGALQAEGIAHARCVGMIETCEESGSYDLPAYLDALAPRMGQVDFVIGLDSGCGDYERLWATTSLRGLAGGILTVQVLTEGVHSGDASGIVPSSFRIARRLLDRIEDAATGAVLAADFNVPIPAERAEEAPPRARRGGGGGARRRRRISAPPPGRPRRAGPGAPRRSSAISSSANIPSRAQ